LTKAHVSPSFRDNATVSLQNCDPVVLEHMQKPSPSQFLFGGLEVADPYVVFPALSLESMSAFVEIRMRRRKVENVQSEKEKFSMLEQD
jgi:hypothetical protein